MAITIEDYFIRIIFPYQKYIIITSIIIVFIVALWIYRWKSIYPAVFSDVANEVESDINVTTNDKNSIFTFYYVKWCPYCIKTKDIFGIIDTRHASNNLSKIAKYIINENN